MKKRLLIRLLLGLAFLMSTGCDSTSTQPEITGIPLPSSVNTADFPATITNPNPMWPLTVGTTMRYVSQIPEGEEVILVEVTDRKKIVQGVTTTIVHDRVFLNDELIEDTEDWYAQDKDGNVWYFGENVKNYTDGQLTDRAGSWESGVDGALAGILMWAQPKVGSIYYQEYYRGQAEDVGEVLSLNETVTVPFGTFQGCLKTEDTTALEPDVLEYKYYCPGISVVLEENIKDGTRVELTDVTAN